MSNIQKAFKNKAKRGLCMAQGGALHLLQGTGNVFSEIGGGGDSAMQADMKRGNDTSFTNSMQSSLDSMQAANEPMRPNQTMAPIGGTGGSFGEPGQPAAPAAPAIPNAMRDMASLGGVDPGRGLGAGAQHNWITQSASDRQGGGNDFYRAGSMADPHRSAFLPANPRPMRFAGGSGSVGDDMDAQIARDTAARQAARQEKPGFLAGIFGGSKPAAPPVTTQKKAGISGYAAGNGLEERMKAAGLAEGTGSVGTFRQAPSPASYDGWGKPPKMDEVTQSIVNGAGRAVDHPAYAAAQFAPVVGTALGGIAAGVHAAQGRTEELPLDFASMLPGGKAGLSLAKGAKLASQLAKQQRIGNIGRAANGVQALSSVDAFGSPAFADGTAEVGTEAGGIVRDPNGKVDTDTVDVKLAKHEAVLPYKTVLAMGGPEAVEQLIESTNGKPTATRGIREGMRVHAIDGASDLARSAKNTADMVADREALRATTNRLPPAIGEGLTTDELRTKLQGPQGNTIRNLQAEAVNTRAAATAAPAPTAAPAAPAPAAPNMIEPLDTTGQPKPTSMMDKAKGVGRSIKDAATRVVTPAAEAAPLKWYQPSAGVKSAGSALRGGAGMATKVIPFAIAADMTNDTVGGLNAQAGRDASDIDARGGFAASTAKDSFPLISAVGEKIGNQIGRTATAINGGTNPNTGVKESFLGSLNPLTNGEDSVMGIADRNKTDRASIGAPVAKPAAEVANEKAAADAATAKATAAAEAAAIAKSPETLQSRSIRSGQLVDEAQNGMGLVPGGTNAITRGNRGLNSIANNTDVRGNLNAAHQEMGDGIAYHVRTGADGKKQTMITGGRPTKDQYVGADGKTTNNYYETSQYAEGMKVAEQNRKALRTIRGYNNEALAKSNFAPDRAKAEAVTRQTALEDANAIAKSEQGIKGTLAQGQLQHFKTLEAQQARQLQMQMNGVRIAQMEANEKNHDEYLNRKFMLPDGKPDVVERAKFDTGLQKIMGSLGITRLGQLSAQDLDDIHERIRTSDNLEKDSNGLYARLRAKITGNPITTNGNPMDIKLSETQPGVFGRYVLDQNGNPHYLRDIEGGGMLTPVDAGIQRARTLAQR